MGIFIKALHSKIDVFVKFESAINLEIRGQIKQKKWIPSIWVTRTICMHFPQNLGRSRLVLHFFLGDLRWNDRITLYSSRVARIYNRMHKELLLECAH